MTWDLEKAEEWVHGPEALLIGVLCAAVSIVISTTHIILHLNNYTMPAIQIYVIRILVICPVYAVSSAIALWLGQRGVYAETFRDIYEAFVIYSFMGLILEFCGGETDCIYQIENEPPLKMPCPMCCLEPIPRDTRLMRLCQRGVLQFVVVKPIFAVLDIIAILCGFYYLPAYQYFELGIYNISYTWALYCMFVFYMATSHIIRNFRPVLKFASVKIIVFATYYQSLAIKASPMPTEDAIVWNDLILCVEMVLFACIHCLAYPTSEFQGGTPDSTFMDNVKDVMKLSDVMQDMYHNFTPIYHDYGLQRSEKEMTGSAVPSSSATGMLSGNLDSVAVEMSHRYRGRNRRFAFNSLLRGDKPIRARLRPVQDMDKIASSDCCSELGSDDEERKRDIEEGIRSESEHSGFNSSHGLLSKKSTHDELIENSKVRNPMLAVPDIRTNIDSQAAASNAQHRDNVVKMRTHGIGLIITSTGGITMRGSDEFPTEDELLVNSHFLNPAQETDRDSLTLDGTKEYRVPLSRYLNSKPTKNALGSRNAAAAAVSSSPAPAEELVSTGTGMAEDGEGMQQEFEFGLSGLMDASYLRQEYQPFKFDDENEDGSFGGSHRLNKHKVTPLAAPVKLVNSFARRKDAPCLAKSAPINSISAAKSRGQQTTSSSPSPFKLIESDLASSLMPELLPKDAMSKGKTRRSLPPLPLPLGHKAEFPTEAEAGAIEESPQEQEAWEPLPWDELQAFPQVTEDANGLNDDEVFEDYQGCYKEAGTNLEQEQRAGVIDTNMNSGNSSVRKFVGKGRKRTNCDSYDPEEDVDAN